MMKCAETGVGEANSGDFRGDGVKRNVRGHGPCPGFWPNSKGTDKY